MYKFRKIVVTISTITKRFLSERKRKYPLNPEDTEKLPVFQYSVSKKQYRRVFAWGNMQTGALGIPYLKSNEKIDKLLPLSFPKRIGFGEKFEVTAGTCGFGFTVFAVNSGTNIKIYGTGLNTDSQIGYHEVRHQKPLGIIFYPRPISLPFSNPTKSRVLKLAAGRAHLMVLTDEGLFILGNNAYGQCGRKIIPDENYTMSNYINHIEKIDGKTIIDVECGQDHRLFDVGHTALYRKDRKFCEYSPKLPKHNHIVHIGMIIEESSPTTDLSKFCIRPLKGLALLEDGSVYSCGWGADGQTGLGHFDNMPQFTRVKGDIESEKIIKLACRSDFVLALNDKGDVFGWGNIEYNQITLPEGEQQLSIPTHIKMLKKVGKIISVASGGSFCVVVNDQGQVYSWGYGLLGAGPEVQQSKTPIRIPEVLFGRNDFQPNNMVYDVVCGLNYAAAITNHGDLYMWGRNKNCCLGLGNEKDQYFPLKVSLSGCVKQVSCGVDHTIAICKPFI